MLYFFKSHYKFIFSSTMWTYEQNAFRKVADFNKQNIKTICLKSVIKFILQLLGCEPYTYMSTCVRSNNGKFAFIFKKYRLLLMHASIWITISDSRADQIHQSSWENCFQAPTKQNRNWLAFPCDKIYANIDLLHVRFSNRYNHDVHQACFVFILRCDQPAASENMEWFDICKTKKH